MKIMGKLPSDIHADSQTDSITQVLAENPQVIFACLVGSRAEGRAKPGSDWDIAVWSDPAITPWHRHAGLCSVQHALASALRLSDSAVDVIDLNAAGLAMRLEVANNGVLLKQDGASVFNRFLVRVWREQEDLAYANALGARLAA